MRFGCIQNTNALLTSLQPIVRHDGLVNATVLDSDETSMATRCPRCMGHQEGSCWLGTEYGVVATGVSSRVMRDA